VRRSVTVKAAWITGGAIVVAALFTGFFTVLKSGAPAREATIVNVYPTGPERLDQGIRTYFQFPPYKSLKLEVGGTLTMAERGVFHYSVSHRVLEQAPVLMVQAADELDARAFRLGAPAQLPFTVYIATHGRRYLLAVEGYDSSGVQIRTFKDWQ